MLLQRGVLLPRKSVKKPRPTPVARGVITVFLVSVWIKIHFAYYLTKIDRVASLVGVWIKTPLNFHQH